MTYPISYFKADGNLVERVANSKEDEAQFRKEGFMLIDELYPDPNAPKKEKK